MVDMSSNFGFFTAWPAIGQPDRDLWVENDPFIWPIPSQPGVGQFTPSNFIAVAAATAALCCSTVPPDSNTRILFLFAMGQPDALQQVVVIAIKDMSFHRKYPLTENKEDKKCQSFFVIEEQNQFETLPSNKNVTWTKYWLKVTRSNSICYVNLSQTAEFLLTG